SRTNRRLSTIWAPIRWILSNSSWHWKRSSKRKFPTRKPRRSRPCSKPLITSTRTARKPKQTRSLLSRRRVVITGLGIVCPVGNTVAEAWSNITAAQSGITRVTKFDATPFASQIAGEVKNFDIGEYIPTKEARRMDTFIHYGMAAAIQAIKDCGIEVTPDNAERIGCVIGSGIGGLPLIEETHEALTTGGARKISPFFVPSSIINMIAGNL